MPRPAPARRLALALLVLALAAFGMTGTAAADVSCTGSIGNQQIDDNLRVPDGASCTLDGTRIDGNLLVGVGATLTATGITVQNIQDDNNEAGRVTVTGSRVDGSVQLEDGRGAILLDRNTVIGNVQVNANTGGVTIRNNTIDGNLQCQSNTPAPTGGGNIVRGSAEDQCASLRGTPSPDPGPDPQPTRRQTSRLSGGNRFETSAAISQSQFPDGARVAYLARADAFADALAGGVLTDGPILLVPQCGELPAVIAAEIRRLNPGRVTALGGTGAVCDALLAAAANA
jgi:hypothetical protein